MKNKRVGNVVIKLDWKVLLCTLSSFLSRAHYSGIPFRLVGDVFGNGNSRQNMATMRIMAPFLCLTSL